MMMKWVAESAVASLLGLAAVGAQAGFITVDSKDAAASTIAVVANNEFKAKLDDLGIQQYTLGASLATDIAGSITYYYYGKEAGYQNDFSSGALSYSSGFTPATQDLFASPLKIGTVQVGPGLLDFRFCAYSSGPVLQGCVTNAANDALGVYSQQSLAFSILGDSAWLFWDDSGAGPDDDHDDMLIKAVFTPTSVPEPGTLALLGIGLLGLGLGTRRKRNE